MNLSFTKPSMKWLIRSCLVSPQTVASVPNTQLLVGVTMGPDMTRDTSVSGTWEVESVPQQKDLLLQGNYNGFSVLEKSDGVWVFKGKIDE